MREHLSSDADDWDFHILYEIPVADPEVLLQYEHYAVEYLRQTAPNRCLNWYPATRLDVNLLTVGARTQSLRAWMRETGIARSTLAFRFHQGWPPEAIIGRAPPPTAALVDFTTTSNVLVVAGKRVLTRREAAAQLGCKPETLTKRLRKYRVPGQQVRIRLYELKLGIRPLAERL